ncbi:MAG: FCD domain-containing protein [Clostridium fessum]
MTISRQLEEISLKMLDFSNTSKEFMQLDRQFHTQIDLCSSPAATTRLRSLQGLWNKCDSFKSIYYSLEGRINDTLSEHAQIIQGLKSRDIERHQTGNLRSSEGCCSNVLDAK